MFCTSIGFAQDVDIDPAQVTFGKADRILPISQYDTQDPKELWQWMSDAETKAGARLLAIPHNGNLSSGLMFDDVTFTARKRLNGDYAQRCIRWEPL